MRCLRFPVLLSLLLLAHCTSAPEQPAPERLNLYIWSEYIDPEIVESFEKETGIDVNISLYESNDEMIAKLQHAGGVRQYDLIVPSNNGLAELIALGLVRQLDHRKLPNLGNLMQRFRDTPFDPGNRYSVAYQWGTVGLMYRKDKLHEVEPTWALLLDERRIPGRFLLIDEMRDMLGVALKFQGASVNSVSADELRRAGELVRAVKSSERFVGFEGGVGAKNKVLAGVADLAIVYNGDAMRGMEEDENVQFVVPQEGSILWLDLLAIPREAPNPDAAHKFINYILSGPVGAKLSNYNRYATPNAAALPLIDEKDRHSPVIYPSDAVLEKLEYLQSLGQELQLYDEVWTAIKAR